MRIVDGPLFAHRAYGTRSATMAGPLSDGALAAVYGQGSSRLVRRRKVTRAPVGVDSMGEA